MVDKLLLSRSGNYSMRVQVPLPLNSLNFNIFGLNLSVPPSWAGRRAGANLDQLQKSL
jgi:hypothetical protein